MISFALLFLLQTQSDVEHQAYVRANKFALCLAGEAYKRDGVGKDIQTLVPKIQDLCGDDRDIFLKLGREAFPEMARDGKFEDSVQNRRTWALQAIKIERGDWWREDGIPNSGP